jgi:hypothetical protein
MRREVTEETEVTEQPEKAKGIRLFRLFQVFRTHFFASRASSSPKKISGIAFAIHQIATVENFEILRLIGIVSAKAWLLR